MMEQEILEAARKLAMDSSDLYDEGVEVYAFPGTDQIRLVALDPIAMPSHERIAAFYFGADPKHGVNYPHGLAVVPPEEKGVVPPPEGWGNWDEAVKVWPPVNGQR